MSAPGSGQDLIEVHRRLEAFACKNRPERDQDLARIAKICSGLDPLQCYPVSLASGSFKTPLEHMVSLLQDYFHGADLGDDAYIRDKLFTAVGEMLTRHGAIERELAWVIPRLLEPLMADRGWNAQINPAGNSYAADTGRTMGLVMPRVLCDDILSGGTAALLCLGSRDNGCDPAWHVLEMVSPAYLDFFVKGATPVISSRRLSREVPAPVQQTQRPGPRL